MEVNVSSNSGKSSGPPGVGNAHTSSTRNSGTIAWIRQWRWVWAVLGRFGPRNIRACMLLRLSSRG